MDINVGVRFESYVYSFPSAANPEYELLVRASGERILLRSTTGQPILIPVSIGTSPANAGPRYSQHAGLRRKGRSLLHPRRDTRSSRRRANRRCHPNGQDGSALFTNQQPAGFSHPVWSPRIGGTYTFIPDNVLRFSYGRYSQPTETAFEQYLNASGLGVAKFDFQHFWGLGFTNPSHDNPVQTSNNYDLSYEQHLKGTDWTFKLSPFFRWTTNQFVTVSLGNNFASAINAATQQTAGVELAVQKGDPTRNGLSGQLTYTFTNAKIKYSTLANGSNAIDIINSYISLFNALTKKGGGSPWYCINGRWS